MIIGSIHVLLVHFSKNSYEVAPNFPWKNFLLLTFWVKNVSKINANETKPRQNPSIHNC